MPDTCVAPKSLGHTLVPGYQHGIAHNRWCTVDENENMNCRTGTAFLLHRHRLCCAGAVLSPRRHWFCCSGAVFPPRRHCFCCTGTVLCFYHRGTCSAAQARFCHSGSASAALAQHLRLTSAVSVAQAPCFCRTGTFCCTGTVLLLLRH